MFGRSGVGLAVGTAEEVDCSEWSGTRMLNAPSSPSNQMPSSGTTGVIGTQVGSAQGFISAASRSISPQAILLALVVVLALEMSVVT